MTRRMMSCRVGLRAWEFLRKERKRMFTKTSETWWTWDSGESGDRKMIVKIRIECAGYEAFVFCIGQLPK